MSSITLKRISSFHDYDIFGTMLKLFTNLVYLGVAILSDINWLMHITKISNKANRTLGLFKTALSHCSQYMKSLPTKCLFAPSFIMMVMSGTRIQLYILRKLNNFKEIYADSSLWNAIETLTPQFSLTS